MCGQEETDVSYTSASPPWEESASKSGAPSSRWSFRNTSPRSATMTFASSTHSWHDSQPFRRDQLILTRSLSNPKDIAEGATRSRPLAGAEPERVRRSRSERASGWSRGKTIQSFVASAALSTQQGAGSRNTAAPAQSYPGAPQTGGPSSRAPGVVRSSGA